MTMFLLFVFPFACPILSVSSLFGVCCMLYVVSCRTVSCSVVLFYGLGVLVDAVVVIVTTIVVVIVVAAVVAAVVDVAIVIYVVVVVVDDDDDVGVVVAAAAVVVDVDFVGVDVVSFCCCCCCRCS